MKYYSIGEFAKLIGRTEQTLRNWDKSNRLKPAYVAPCGFRYKYGTTIEIIDNTEKTEEQELVEDLVQIITVFSCKLQGKRANKAKRMVKELTEND
ncbi:MerR family transcriptional regulator [Anoxybacillus sp. TBDG-1]